VLYDYTTVCDINTACFGKEAKSVLHMSQRFLFSNDLQINARLSIWRSERLGLDIIYSGLLGSNSQSHRFGCTATQRF